MEIITYILAVIGLVVLTNKSVFFLPIREFLKEKYNNNTRNIFYWFFFNIFSCGMCMSFWAGIICYLPIYFDLAYILYPLVAVSVVTFSFKKYENM
jgi:hypothetical protein